MSCLHLKQNPSAEGHVLPCRDKFCIPCVERIEGLMEGGVFECPLCGNFSQYVNPQSAVFGEEGSSECGYAREDYNLPPDVVQESIEADSYSGSGAARSVSDGGEYRDPRDSVMGALSKEKGVQWQKLQIEQKEMWDQIEKEKQMKERSKSAPRVQTLATNDSSGSQRSYEGHERDSDRYKNTPNNAAWYTDKQQDSDQSMETNGYSEEGLCFRHHRYITFACKECNELLCELCRSSHALQHPFHSFNRMSDLLNRSEQGESPPKDNTTKDSTATVRTDKVCKYHNMPYVMYCESGKQMLCKRCYEEDHRFPGCFGGSHWALKFMSQRMNNKFQAHFSTLESRKRKLTEVSHKAASNVSNLLEASDTLKKKVKTATQQAIDQLRENEDVMIKQIESEVESKIAKQKDIAEKANVLITEWNEVEEIAQSALQRVEDNYFDDAQTTEEDVRKRITYLDSKHPRATLHSCDGLNLDCQINRTARYNINEGFLSRAPIRLCKPTMYSPMSAAIFSHF